MNRTNSAVPLHDSAAVAVVVDDAEHSVAIKVIEIDGDCCGGNCYGCCYHSLNRHCSLTYWTNDGGKGFAVGSVAVAAAADAGGGAVVAGAVETDTNRILVAAVLS